MSVISFLQSIGIRHGFTFNNEGTDVNDDIGTTTDPTRIFNGTYNFVTNPTCESVTHALQTTTGGFSDGAILQNRLGINNSNSGGDGSTTFDWNVNNYGVFCWVVFDEDINEPTSIYEQGGGTNNVAISAGIGGAITGQAADAGEEFLIAQSQFIAKKDVPDLVGIFWQHHTNHSGSGNRISITINGVINQIVERTSTANFPGHSGDIAVGNTSESLQSYNGSTLRFAQRQKRLNYLGIFANVGTTDPLNKFKDDLRNLMERTSKSLITIEPDTVENQQAQLDTLKGNTYDLSLYPCAIRILQATDKTDYRLLLDDVTFIHDQWTNNIDIQYVGPNTLTIENCNGSNAMEISTPDELERTSGTIVGGGSLNINNDVIRQNVVSDLSNISGNKLVIETSGTYNLTNVDVDEIENVSGGVVNITTDIPINTITNDIGSTTNVNIIFSFN